MISDGIVMTTRSSMFARNRAPSDANTLGRSAARSPALVTRSAPLADEEDVVRGLRRAALASHDARHLPAMVRTVQRDVQQDVFDRVHEFVALRVAVANPELQLMRGECLCQECEGGVALQIGRAHV